MERQFPKNVKQVGNVSDTPKIYMEDYVDTFLNQLKESGSDSMVGAFLIGERVAIEGQDCVYITGAVQMRDLDLQADSIQVNKEHLEVAKAESGEYFHGQDVVGWMLMMSDRPLALDKHMIGIHEELFPEKNSVFILRDFEDGEKYYTYKFHDLMHIGGHYIFYEKNPDMQNYMINERKQIGVTPSEMVEDRAAKNFRSTVRDRMEIREQRRESRYVYLTSILLVVVVLAIGISTMNNYDKINSVQTSIETLSEVMKEGGKQQSDKQAVQKVEEEQVQAVNQDISGKEEEAQAGKQETDSESTDSEKTGANQDSGGEKEKTAEEIAAETGMEPIKSTIQEDLSSDEYYIVQKGDTLDTISRKLYGTTSEADAICRMNGLKDGNLIFIGQKLLLP